MLTRLQAGWFRIVTGWFQRKKWFKLHHMAVKPQSWSNFNGCHNGKGYFKFDKSGRIDSISFGRKRANFSVQMSTRVATKINTKMKEGDKCLMLFPVAMFMQAIWERKHIVMVNVKKITWRGGWIFERQHFKAMWFHQYAWKWFYYSLEWKKLNKIGTPLRMIHASAQG